MNKVKKVSFISAIFIVICGTIGSGIFFKNTEILLVNYNSLFFTILSWVLASIGILFLIVSLGNISKKIALNDLGLLQWNKSFNSDHVYRMCRNFMVYFYLPFVSFGMALYMVQSLQNAFNWNDAQWWQIFLIAALVILFFSLTSGNKSHQASFVNNILLVFKIFPIVFIVIFGFYKIGSNDMNDFPLFGNNDGGVELGINDLKYTRPFLSLSPATGIFASVPAIYFTFDGFYKVTTIQKDLKEPQKMSKVIVVGVFSIATIYVILTIFLLIGFENGNVINVNLENGKVQEVLKIILGVLVAISLLGCINANSIMGAKIFQAVSNEGGLKIFSFIKIKSSNENTMKGNIIFNIIGIFALLFIVIFGAFFFMNSSNYNFQNEQTNRMYSFLDLLLGWTSLLIFIMILLPVFGCFKINANDKKYLTFSIISSIFVTSGLVFAVIEATGNLVIMASNDYFYNIDSQFYDNNPFDMSKEEVFAILNRNYLATIAKFVFLIIILFGFSLNCFYYFIKNKRKDINNELSMKKGN